MVTPSLVMVGEPNFLSRSAYRPRGPRVTLTASAILSTPRFSARRASSSNRICFATLSFVLLKMRPPACRGDRLLDDGQDVLLGGEQRRVGDVLLCGQLAQFKSGAMAHPLLNLVA